MFFVIGIVTMLIPVVISVLVPQQSNQLYVFNRALMSVGGGLAGGGILGFLNINIEVLNHVIKGGGGFAIFIVLYMFNPPAEVANASAPPERREALQEITELVEEPPPTVQPSGSDPTGPKPLRPAASEAVQLDEVVKGLGFSSVQQFRTTASMKQIETVKRDLTKRKLPGLPQ